MAKKTNPKANCGCGGGGKKKRKEPLRKVKPSCKKPDKKPRGTPRNAFLAFRAEVQVRLLRKDPTISMIEISRRAGYCWGKLSEEQKDIYRKRVCGENSPSLTPSRCYCPTCHRILPLKRRPKRRKKK